MPRKSHSPDERLHMRTTSEFLAELDDWRRKQDVIPSRTDALHELCRLGIAAWEKSQKIEKVR
jgi:hypothetical protein